MSNGHDAPAEGVRRFETCGRAWIGVLRHVWSAGEAGMADRGPIIEGPPLLFEIASLSWEDPLLREHGDRACLTRRAEQRTRPAASRGPGGRPDVPPEPGGRPEASAVSGAGPDAPPGSGARSDPPSGADARPDVPAAPGARPGTPPAPDAHRQAEQIRWVVDLLRARPWTTSAWICLTIPGEAAEGLPALTAVAFRIRGYRLHMTATFRAQNVHRAYLAYIPLRDVQVHVADRLGLPSGPLRVFIDVPHLHVADADRVASILANQPEPNAA